ncbi:amino acid adenylation domain-containing protein [Actinoplanes sp. NPDC049668]|uniref:non-ribosomal peptide synthetase n=1 Tax=unclassified Actinoplanes TaxID=2626549 RepID=UPI0033AF968B
MLSDSQRAALAARLRQGRGTTTIPRRDPNLAELPLSSGQEQLWFIDQFAPGLPTYNVAGTLNLEGDLDAPALGRAFDALVARHEILRTRIDTVDGRPVQVVDAPPDPVNLTVRDLSGLSEAERLSTFAAESIAFGLLPFDLAKGPLIRTELVRLTPRHHALHLNVHHSAFDGWSFAVCVRELAALYAAEVAGTPAGLPELPIQFADYALWERARLDGAGVDELVAYWKEALHGAASVQLPTDRPRPVLQSFDGAIARKAMGADVLAGLRELGRAEGTTTFVTLLSALQVLLHRYSGQDDIVVGTASANRGRGELAQLIGYLVNTLPIRTDTSGDPTFTELLGRVKETVLGAYAHQELPFPRLVEALKVERDASRAPLFQIGFTINEDEPDRIEAGGVTVSVEPIDAPTAKFDLNFFMQAHGDLVVEVAYATALYDAATVARMLDSLEVLFRGIVADPSRRLSDLPVLTEHALHQELVGWNSNTMDLPPALLHELVQRQTARVPDAQAAVMDGRALTYAQLNAAANRGARRLRAAGVGPESLVGVHMRPSIERFAGILAILKAGGAWVPLDPDYPADRLEFMIEDADVRVILADAGGRDFGATVIVPARDWPDDGEVADTDLDVALEPVNAAYVIYTSGSTGRPKGVIVEHRQVSNFVQGVVAQWGLDEHDRFLQFASLNFDVSVMDMFLALGSGGAAIFGSRETLMSPPRLIALMRDERVTFACLPPAVLNLISGAELPDQRVLISAGEELSGELVRSWLRPGLRLCNGYGPTEVTIGATIMELGPEDVAAPPIGLPKPNYRAYVLDSHLHPVPVGVAGELHLGGPGVARGYLNRPELTAEKFVKDPFVDEAGARMYRTGDLVRRRPDGNLVFLGRIDGQIKIRGLRVELGEIETAMATHEAVLQAAVVVRDDAAGDKQLVGYARVAPGGPALSIPDLRQHLSQMLPAYMIPTHILVLDALPLNASGKIDRAALPDPDVTEADTAFVAPRTLIETAVTDMYANLLKLERVSVEDSFFDLGGNSLQAMRLITRLRTDLAVDADVTAVFLAPTPAQLTVLLRDKFGLDDIDLGDEDLDAVLS